MTVLLSSLRYLRKGMGTAVLLGCLNCTGESGDSSGTGPTATGIGPTSTGSTDTTSTTATTGASTTASNTVGSTSVATIGSVSTTTASTSTSTTSAGGASTTGGAGGSGGSLGGAGGASSTAAGGMPAVATNDATTGAGGTQSATFQPCPMDEPCRILPLGDSITDGFSTPGGYRIELFSLSLAAGKDITFVGGSSNGPSMVDGQPFPQNHEGHSGWTIQQIDDITPSPSLDVDPHIILLHIGTNDMNGNPSGADGRLATLVDEILDNAPDALLAVSNIIPFPANAGSVDAFNAEVPGIVSARADAGAHIIFVDQFTDFPTSELADGVHPNPDGYARMANVWYEAIEAYLP